MLGAGTVINPIIKIVTTVAILAAVYFFIVKPTLDTTEDITDSVTESSQQITEGVNESINDSFDNANEVQRQIQREIRQSNPGADVDVPQSSQDSIKEATRLLNCIQDAAGDVTAMQACQP